MMTRSLFLAAALVLSTAAHAADSSDPFLAAGEEGATPSTTPTPTPSTPDNPAPSLGSKETPAEVAKPTPEAQAPLPVNSIPGKTESSPAAGSSLDANQNKDIYDQYYDYLDAEKNRQSNVKDMDMRNMFPHENGAWQFSLMYSLTAFGGYDFNFQPDTVLGSPHTYGSTQGGSMLVNWFPIHSLTVGRLGFGVNGGMFWTKFSTPTQSTVIDPNTGKPSTATVQTTSKPQNIITYGVRATYEFDYFLGQILVPYGFVGVDEVAIQAYNVSAGTTKYLIIPRRQLVSQYYGGGVHFNLNRVEPVVGSRALVNVGIKKFYLSYAALQRTGALVGLTHSLGLNFEF